MIENKRGQCSGGYKCSLHSLEVEVATATFMTISIIDGADDNL